MLVPTHEAKNVCQRLGPGLISTMRPSEEVSVRYLRKHRPSQRLMLAVSGGSVAREPSVIGLPLLPLLALFPFLEGVLHFFFWVGWSTLGAPVRRTDEPTTGDQRTVTDEPIPQPTGKNRIFHHSPTYREESNIRIFSWI